MFGIATKLTEKILMIALETAIVTAASVAVKLVERMDKHLFNGSDDKEEDNATAVLSSIFGGGAEVVEAVSGSHQKPIISMTVNVNSNNGDQPVPEVKVVLTQPEYEEEYEDEDEA
jgi:hypothetical protein